MKDFDPNAPEYQVRNHYSVLEAKEKYHLNRTSVHQPNYKNHRRWRNDILREMEVMRKVYKYLND